MPNYLQKVSEWFTGLFFKKKTVKKENPTPAVSISKNPGLNCPECATRIPVDIKMLLQSNAITCPSCSLELEVDREKSEGALNALSKLQSGLHEAAAVRQNSNMG